MSFWIWCEVICSQCSRHLVGEYTKGKMPIGWIKDELKRKRVIHEGEEVFCSAVCRDQFKKRASTKEILNGVRQ